MPDDVSVEINGDDFDRAMRLVPGKLHTHLREHLYAYHTRFLNKFKRTRLRAGSSGDGVQSRSKALSRSFHTERMGDDLDSLLVRTFSAGVPYAAIQEEGGEVRPKTAQWLTIPLAAAKSPAGIAKGSARSFSDTFFRMIGDRLFIFQKQGDEVVPLFRLVKSVRIKGTLGFFKTWQEQRGAFAAAVNKATKEALQPEAVS